jgi:replicative DNA helicase
MGKMKFIEAEQQVIINVLNGRETSLSQDDLVSEANQVLLTVAKELRAAGAIPDMITVKHKLEKDKLLALAGGESYLEDIYSAGAPVDNIEPYEDIVKEEATRRSLQAFHHKMGEMLENSVHIEDILAMAQTEPLKLSLNARVNDTVDIVQAMEEVIQQVRDKKAGVATSGVPLEINQLQRLMNGLQPSDLIVVAGRPSMGKTAFGTQIATYCSKVYGPAFIGSLEMDRSSLCERILAGETGMDSNNIRVGTFINQYELDKMVKAAERYKQYHPLFINDTPRLSASDLRLEMIRLKSKHDIKLAVIDYLGLIKEESAGMQRYRELGVATKILRATARELKIPVVILCQLNRSCELRDNKRPTLSDLRESGDIEQDADAVIMVYRDEYYCNDCASGKATDKCYEEHKGTGELLLRKQRKGPTGTAMTVWRAEQTRFENIGEFGSGHEPEEELITNIHTHQEPENTEDSQQGFSFKGADGNMKEFPNQAPDLRKKDKDNIPF